MNFVQAGLELKSGRDAQSAAEQNAAIEREKARNILGETQRRTLASRQEGRSAESQITVAAASGGLAQTGTVLQAKIAASRNAELNALEDERLGLTEARRLEHSAQMDVFRGKVARRTSYVRAAGSVVKGVGNIISGAQG